MSGYRTTLAPWARITGAAALAALALLDLAWMGRDFGKAAQTTDVWWMWCGVLFRARDGVWATSFAEPTLLVLYAICCALTLARSATAPGLLGAAGALTALFRLPGLWTLNAEWVQGGVTEGLRDKAFAGVVAALVLSAVLLVAGIAGIAGHRTGAEDEHRTGGRAGDAAVAAGLADPAGHGAAPAGPSAAGSTAAALLLAASGGVLAARELDDWHEQGWELYAHHLTGDRSLATLLAVPAGWYAWALALSVLAAAAVVLRRGPYARPLGMAVTAPLLGLSVSSVSFAARTGLLAGYGDLGVHDQLRLASEVFWIVAGLAVLAALAPHAPAGPEAAAPGPGSGSGSAGRSMPAPAEGYPGSRRRRPGDRTQAPGHERNRRRKQEDTAMKQQEPEAGGGDRGKPAGADEERRKRLREHTASGTAPKDVPRAEGDRDDDIGDIQDRGTEHGHPRT